MTEDEFMEAFFANPQAVIAQLSALSTQQALHMGLRKKVAQRGDLMISRMIAFFLIPALIFLAAHFWAADANGQSMPMNPVDTDGKVNPLAVYLNTFDTYRVLQHHEALNQSVFYACDTTGGQSVAANDSAFVNLDKSMVVGSIFCHATDDYAVAVNKNGTYEISYQLSVDASTTIAIRSSLRWYSSSWENIPGATQSTLVVSDGGSASATVIWPLSSGDSLAVYLKNLSGATSLVTEVDGVGLTIKKLY